MLSAGKLSRPTMHEDRVALVWEGAAEEVGTGEQSLCWRACSGGVQLSTHVRALPLHLSQPAPTPEPKAVQGACRTSAHVSLVRVHA